MPLSACVCVSFCAPLSLFPLLWPLTTHPSGACNAECIEERTPELQVDCAEWWRIQHPHAQQRRCSRGRQHRRRYSFCFGPSQPPKPFREDERRTFPLSHQVPTSSRAPSTSPACSRRPCPPPAALPTRNTSHNLPPHLHHDDDPTHAPAKRRTGTLLLTTGTSSTPPRQACQLTTSTLSSACRATTWPVASSTSTSIMLDRRP